MRHRGRGRDRRLRSRPPVSEGGRLQCVLRLRPGPPGGAGHRPSPDRGGLRLPRGSQAGRGDHRAALRKGRHRHRVRGEGGPAAGLRRLPARGGGGGTAGPHSGERVHPADAPPAGEKCAAGGRLVGDGGGGSGAGPCRWHLPLLLPAERLGDGQRSHRGGREVSSAGCGDPVYLPVRRQQRGAARAAGQGARRGGRAPADPGAAGGRSYGAPAGAAE